MARKAKELSPIEVSRLKSPGNHAVGGVAGLYLYVNDAGARSWVLRIMVGAKRRHMGLGVQAGFVSAAQCAPSRPRHCWGCFHWGRPWASGTGHQGEPVADALGSLLWASHGDDHTLP